MIELTEQQRHELIATDTPQILDPGTGKTYVLVQSEIYQRLKGLLDDEPGVTGEMMDRLMEQEDLDDPTLAFYQREYGRKPWSPATTSWWRRRPTSARQSATCPMPSSGGSMTA